MESTSGAVPRVGDLSFLGAIIHVVGGVHF